MGCKRGGRQFDVQYSAIQLTAENLVYAVKPCRIAREGVVWLHSVDAVQIVEPGSGVGEDEVRCEPTEVLQPETLMSKARSAYKLGDEARRMSSATGKQLDGADSPIQRCAQPLASRTPMSTRRR